MIRKDCMPLRTVLAAGGVLLAGISVSIFRCAAFGVDPFQCFAGGLENVIPIPFGTLYLLLNLVILVLIFILARRYIGVSTFINIFLLGYVIDWGEKLLRQAFPAPDIGLRIALLAIAVLILCVASAMYYTADLGVSVYDAVSLHAADRKPRVAGKVVPFRFIRIFFDVLCVLAGLAMGVRPGIGTIVTALMMGPLISFFRRRFTDPLLARAQAKERASAA